MVSTVLLLLLGLQLKHFLADYVFQTGRMVHEKGNLRQLGGYAHAGVHLLGTLIVLLLVVPPSLKLLAVLAAEFVIHYAIDFAKVRGSGNVKITAQPKLFWTLHGLDQLLHHLTYLGIVLVVTSWVMV